MDFIYSDSHLHITGRENSGCNHVLSIAQNHGISSLLANSAEEDEWEKLSQLSLNNVEIIPFWGIHPWYADTVHKGWDTRLRNYLKKAPKKCGIGEVGLDKKCGISSQIQEEVFLTQLQIATELQVPLSLHCVGRWGRMVDIVKSLKNPPPMLFHGFNGSLEVLYRLQSEHTFFSFKYSALHNEKHLNLLKKIPIDNILLETDLPHPVDKGGCAKAFADLIALYHEVATIHNLSVQQFVEQVKKNGKIYTTRSSYR